MLHFLILALTFCKENCVLLDESSHIVEVQIQVQSGSDHFPMPGPRTWSVAIVLKLSRYGLASTCMADYIKNLCLNSNMGERREIFFNLD